MPTAVLSLLSLLLLLHWRLRRLPPTSPLRLRHPAPLAQVRPVLHLAPTLLRLGCRRLVPPLVTPVGRRFSRGWRMSPVTAAATVRPAAVSAAAHGGPQARVASANAWHATTNRTHIEGWGEDKQKHAGQASCGIRSRPHSHPRCREQKSEEKRECRRDREQAEETAPDEGRERSLGK